MQTPQTAFTSGATAPCTSLNPCYQAERGLQTGNTQMKFHVQCLQFPALKPEEDRIEPVSKALAGSTVAARQDR